VLLNLVSNATRFTEQGGIYITAEDQPDSLLISVRDTGPGISAEDVERIFDPFCQGSVNQTYREKGGTGLELTISRQFIELHGGKIGLKARSEKARPSFSACRKSTGSAHRHAPALDQRALGLGRSRRQARFSSEILRARVSRCLTGTAPWSR